jgi:hypothetical protein
VKQTTKALLSRIAKLEAAMLPSRATFWSVWQGLGDAESLTGPDLEMWKEAEAIMNDRTPGDRLNRIDAFLASLEAMPPAPLPPGLKELSPDEPHITKNGETPQ